MDKELYDRSLRGGGMHSDNKRVDSKIKGLDENK